MNNMIWYIPDEAGQPAGPYSADQISEWLTADQIPQTTICWREGMPDWLPLTRVEPFAGELKRIKAAAKKRMYRILIAASSIVCTIAVGVVAYLIIMGPPEVRNAKKLIAAELYTQAAQELEQYVKHNPLNDEAAYLLAIAKVKQYAAAESGRFGAFGSLTATQARLEEPKQILARIFKADSKWIEKARKEITNAVELIPVDTPDSFNRNLEISRLRAELNLADKKKLAGELMAKLVAQGDLQGNYNLYQGVILEILGWDSSLSNQVIELVLSDGNVSAQQLSWSLATLQRWAGQRPAFAKALSKELLNRAESSNAAGGKEQAKVLLSKAFELNPEAAKSEEHAFLYIKLMNPDDTKLTRCQLFLRDYPGSNHRPDVLMTILQDSVAISKQYGWLYRNKAELYLSAGLSAAKELIRQEPKMPNLDVQVLELAKKMTERKKFHEVISLMSDLLAAVPDSVIKMQIEQAVAQWRLQSGRGTLPPDFDALADRIEEELKILPLSAPGALRTLQANPHAVHVVNIAWDCTAEKFSSEEVKILRNWVANGGILWATNNVLQLFQIKFAWGRSDFWLNWRPVHQCRAAVTPNICPILTGCNQVVLSMQKFPAANLNYDQVIPLLTSEGVNSWSLIPYGKGWISDVKTVDRNQYDGARFWLNFQLFCLSWDIPGAPEGLQIGQKPPRIETFEPPEGSLSAPRIRSPQITRITDTAELEKLLAADDSQQVIWVALSRKDIDIKTRAKLRSWVRAGGALWIETDLARSFGFAELRTAGRNSLSGQAEITRVRYPIISHLSGKIVSFELDPNGVAIRGTWLAISQKMSPLLVQPNIQNNIITVVCAVSYDGDGVVILRPAKIDTTSPAGQDFESCLLSFSLSSKSERQTMVPRAERQRPTIRSRRRR